MEESTPAKNNIQNKDANHKDNVNNDTQVDDKANVTKTNGKTSNVKTPNRPNHYQPTAATNQQKQKSKWWWILPLIVLALGVGLLMGRIWGQSAGQQDNDVTASTDAADSQKEKSFLEKLGLGDDEPEVLPQKPVLTVEVITPQQATVPNTITADGTIEAKNVATVNSKVNGVTIEQVLVDEGDRVEQGDVLAIFDTDAMEQQAYQAKADLMDAQTRLQLAQSNVDRITPLVSMQAISEQERDRYVATANQAAAAVEAAKARLSNQNLNINNARVVAPVSGVISEKNINVGSVAGGGTMFTIIENGELEWQAKIDPSKLNKVGVGTPVQVSLPQDNYVNGQVSRIAPTADTGSRQVSIYASLNSNPLARAGMYQRGVILIDKQDKQILPTSAIVSQDGYDYIMLVQSEKDANGERIYRINRHKVSVDSRENNAVILTDPLPANTAIVRQGGSFLNDGDVVTVANLNAPAAPTRSANLGQQP